jgi:microcystin-dependent protein
MSYTIQLRSDTAANWSTANPILAIGEMGFETDTKVLRVGDGVTAWNTSGGPPTIGGTPTGVIAQFAGATAPNGYLLCQGQTLSTTTYANLFATIGYTYGGGGSDFKVPDLQSRIPVGKGSDTEFDTLGETGGAKTVTLSSSQIPAHSHPNTLSSNTVASSGHSHGPGSYAAGIGATNNNTGAIGYVASFVRGGGPTQSTYTVTGSSVGSQNFNHYTPVYGDSAGPSGTTTVGITNENNTGGGGAHTNLQPYIVVNYIIKT